MTVFDCQWNTEAADCDVLCIVSHFKEHWHFFMCFREQHCIRCKLTGGSWWQYSNCHSEYSATENISHSYKHSYNHWLLPCANSYKKRFLFQSVTYHSFVYYKNCIVRRCLATTIVTFSACLLLPLRIRCFFRPFRACTLRLKSAYLKRKHHE